MNVGDRLKRKGWHLNKILVWQELRVSVLFQHWSKQTKCKYRFVSSATAALSHHHVLETEAIGEDALGVQVEDGYGVEPCRHTAGPWSLGRVYAVHESLDDGVFGRAQVVT